MKCELITKEGVTVKNINPYFTRPGNIILRDRAGFVWGVTDGVIISAYYALTPREIGGIGVQYINKAFMHSADKTECAVFEDYHKEHFPPGEWDEIQRLREEWLNMEVNADEV